MLLTTVNSLLILSVALQIFFWKYLNLVQNWIKCKTANKLNVSTSLWFRLHPTWALPPCDVLCIRTWSEYYLRKGYLWARWCLNEPFAVHSLWFQSLTLLLHHSRLDDAFRPTHLKITRCNILHVTKPFTAVWYACSADWIIEMNLLCSARGVSMSLNSGSEKIAMGLE